MFKVETKNPKLQRIIQDIAKVDKEATKKVHTILPHISSIHDTAEYLTEVLETVSSNLDNINTDWSAIGDDNKAVNAAYASVKLSMLHMTERLMVVEITDLDDTVKSISRLGLFDNVTRYLKTRLKNVRIAALYLISFVAPYYDNVSPLVKSAIDDNETLITKGCVCYNCVSFEEMLIRSYIFNASMPRDDEADLNFYMECFNRLYEEHRKKDISVYIPNLFCQNLFLHLGKYTRTYNPLILQIAKKMGEISCVARSASQKKMYKELSTKIYYHPTVLEQEKYCLNVTDEFIKELEEEEILKQQRAIKKKEKRKQRKQKQKEQSNPIQNDAGPSPSGNKPSIQLNDDDDDDAIVAMGKAYCEDECVMCWDAQATIIFTTCRHCVCCGDCAKTLYQLEEKKRLCPLCRASLTEM